MISILFSLHEKSLVDIIFAFKKEHGKYTILLSKENINKYY